MSTPNVVPFLSTNTLGADLAKAARLYGTNASISFRQNSKYANSPLPFLDRRSMRGAALFQFYMFGDTPSAEQEYQSGDALLGQDYAMGTGTVNVDEIITAHKVVGEKDALISHINMAPLLGTENGRKVAIDLDYRVLNQMALCPRTSAITDTGTGLTIAPAGFRVTRNGGSATVATAMTNAYPLSSTGAANLRADLRALAYTADVNQWPEESRWIILDAYLRQVLQFDTTGTLFSRDYQEMNKTLDRTIEKIDGWRVYAWETRRTTQGGLLPDSNETSFVRSTKFNANFTPGASNGYPCVLAFCAAGEDQACVGFGTWQPVTARTIGPEIRGNHTTLYETYCLTGIEKMRHYSAASIEVLSN